MRQHLRALGGPLLITEAQRLLDVIHQTLQGLWSVLGQESLCQTFKRLFLGAVRPVCTVQFHRSHFVTLAHFIYPHSIVGILPARRPSIALFE